MSSSQHRCVFVGNIPYDATEEQLIQICEEVGPVVSFRLVVDRETGKPKGYGFCEFRDEETALSARRNLQGYDINGRQLRVDFAENEKGNSGERGRDQGRGGPGLSSISSNAEAHRQSGGVAISGISPPDQPVGFAAAATAATVMMGAMNGSQQPLSMPGIGAVHDSGQMNGHFAVYKGSDPLSRYLAGMSKNQLYDVLSQMKAFVQQNQQEARKILAAKPHFAKALFQVEILLGMVQPHQLTVQPHLAPSVVSAAPVTATAAATVSSSLNPAPHLPLYTQQPPSMTPPQSLGNASQVLLPPLPFQPRPPKPPPSIVSALQVQTYPSQSMSFQVPPIQQQKPQLPQFQVNFPQFSTGITFQHTGTAPLPPHQLAQQSYQIGSASSIVSSVQAVSDSSSSPSIAPPAVEGLGMAPGSFSPVIRANSAVSSNGLVVTGTLPQTQLPSRELEASGAVKVGQVGNASVFGSSGNVNMEFPGAVTAVVSSSLGVNAGLTFLGEIAKVQPRPSAIIGSQEGGFGASSTSQHQFYSQLPQALPQPPQVQGSPTELEKQNLLQQVMNLTPEQINSLPPDQRQQVLQLQQALR